MFPIPILLIFLHFQSSQAHVIRFSPIRNDTLIFEIDVFCAYPNSDFQMEIKEIDLFLKVYQKGDEKGSSGYEWIAHISHNCNSKAEIKTLEVYDRDYIVPIPLKQDTKISFLIDLTNYDYFHLWPIVHIDKI
ncbi:unnamed protein product [Caenorhabditis angaria]|uniref:Uncharacterized protein n=1 Tax=Caenorhabditis angaria TaxID=860376 RepID=A0A9P1ILQ7_9PELO|nr:unnamed protein product [Caenorhabditis angaria]